MNEAIERIWLSNDWITILLLIVISLIVFNKLRYAERFSRLQSLLLNNAYISNYSKSTPILLNTFNFIFYFIIIVVLSLLLFVGINEYNSSPESNSFTYFIKVLTYVFLFIILRFFTGFLIGMLFEKEKQQQHFTFLKISYLSNFCLIMTPLLIINFYSTIKGFSIFLIITALLLFLYYYFLFIKNNQKLIFNKLFYFILYLCALEIAPFIIIYELLII